MNLAVVRNILLESLDGGKYAGGWRKSCNRIVLPLGKDGIAPVCMHIFDRRFATRDSELVHSHPCGFRSKTVAGELTQRRYKKSPDATASALYNFVDTDASGNVIEQGTAWLREGPMEVYPAGTGYAVSAREMHLVHAKDGTVTLVRHDGDSSANVGVSTCWPIGEGVFGDLAADSRIDFKQGPVEFSREELEETIRDSLARWW